MNHHDHVRLLRDGVQPGGLWADFGSGAGAFTLALADLVGPTATIHSIDYDRHALETQRDRLRRRFPTHDVQYHLADYTRPLSLPPLDGIVMANALHFQRNKQPVVESLWTYLRPGGKLIIVEYDTDRGNRWVPYPLRFETWYELAANCNFRETRRLAAVPSSFLGRIYAALSVKPQSDEGADRFG